MSKFRDQIVSTEDNKLETIKAGCPICKSDVKGDDVYLFYCKPCNLLFKRDELRLNSPEYAEFEVKKRIVNKYDKDKDKIRIDDDIKIMKTKQLTAKQKNIIENKKIYYFASKSSNIVHANNCPYAKNIKKENKIIFKSLEQAEKYKKCKCVN